MPCRSTSYIISALKIYRYPALLVILNPCLPRLFFLQNLRLGLLYPPRPFWIAVAENIFNHTKRRLPLLSFPLYFYCRPTLQYDANITHTFRNRFPLLLHSAGPRLVGGACGTSRLTTPVGQSRHQTPLFRRFFKHARLSTLFHPLKLSLVSNSTSQLRNTAFYTREDIWACYGITVY